MTYDLRGYQSEAVDHGVAYLRGNTRDTGGLIVAPTGSGKSLVIANIVKRLREPALVFQPSKEILEQNVDKLRGYGFDPAIYSASMNRKDIGEITLATIGSVRKVPDWFNHVRYVLVDECHLVNPKKGTYRDFLAALPNPRVLGLTATPFRLHRDGYGGSILKFLTRTRPTAFSRLLHTTQIPHLVSQGFIAKPVYQRVTGFTRDVLKTNTTGADYDDASLKRYYKESGFDDRLRRAVVRTREVGRKRTIVFTSFVENAQALADNIDGVALLSSDTPAAERKAIIAQFRAGHIQTIANVGVLQTGVDFPELDTVVLAAPTMSLMRYMQQVGRVVRPFPGLDKWVIDMVDNLGMFGPVEELRLVDSTGRGQFHFIGSSGQPLTNRYFGQKPRKPSRFGGKPNPWRRW